MTMTDTIEQPKPKKHIKRRKKRVAAKVERKPPPVPAEFAGITATACCSDCKSDRCVITQIGICGHPMKGGLQPPLMVKPDVVDRYARARKVLAHVKVDLREGK